MKNGFPDAHNKQIIFSLGLTSGRKFNFDDGRFFFLVKNGFPDAHHQHCIFAFGFTGGRNCNVDDGLFF